MIPAAFSGLTPSYLRSFFSYLVDFILPRSCIVCSQEIGEGLVCNNCLDNIIDIKPPRCPVCGRSIKKTRTCRYCRNEKSLDYGRAFAFYLPPLDKMIHHLKYRRKTALAKFLGLGMANLVNSDHYLKKADYLVPVPLYWIKRMRRGYNQSRLLAREIARECSIGIQDVLVRTKNTRTQTRLSEQKRQENVRNAFKLRSGNVQGKIVVLVDDVMTTGATVRECARVIKDAGAKEVYSLVAAITPG